MPDSKSRVAEEVVVVVVEEDDEVLVVPVPLSMSKVILQFA